MKNEPNKKKEIIKAFAKFLVHNQAGKGMMLQVEQNPNRRLEPKLAQEWANLRTVVDLVGYPNEAEAIEQLTRLLS